MGSTAVRAEACLQFELALPTAMANLLQRSSIWITWAFVGHLGAEFLGPVTLASSVNNVLGTSVVGGLAFGVATLASQAHGAGNNLALSRVLQRAILVGLVGSLPCVLILLFMKHLLLALRMSEQFASRAGNYAYCVLFVTPCVGVQRAVGLWLVSQKNTTPRLIVQAIALPIHAGLTWFLTCNTSLHYIGAGIAMSLNESIQLALLYAYLSFAPSCSQAWQGFGWEALYDWGPYLQVALPGILMNAEFFVGESLTFAASLLPNPNVCLSSLSIYQLTQTTCYQFPSGVRQAICARIGAQLGSGHADKATMAKKAGLWLILIWIMIPLCVLLTFTHHWGLIFTTDGGVLELLRDLVYVLLAYSSSDAILAYYNGVLASCGLQRISGKWAIFAYVFVSLPCALMLAFILETGALGLVLGHTIGKISHTVPCFLAVQRIDWEVECTHAIERVHRVSSSTTS